MANARRFGQPCPYDAPGCPTIRLNPTPHIQRSEVVCARCWEDEQRATLAQMERECLAAS